MKERVTRISDGSFHQKKLQILKKLLLDNSYPIKLINKNLFSTSSTLKNGGMLGQISDREWLDSDAALSQHHITQGSSVVDFRITQEPDDSQHYNGLPVMQETKDNENMNDVGPIETGHLEEHGEEHIIYTSLPYLKNMTPRLTRLFNNAVKMKIANRSDLLVCVLCFLVVVKSQIPFQSTLL
ncbi:hypothetical protein WA026_020830 [Henosepilachna vigintioctopunctata]|uniref:Helix-turn-helix domain-containing protein n=1 Tax=Henosepilachna vigintioctopunctata TaxID=420089 RepID=A0AAW1TNK0_9CUCU